MRGQVNSVKIVLSKAEIEEIKAVGETVHHRTFFAKEIDGIKN